MEEQMCVHCEEYFDEDEMTMVYEGEWVCPSCLEENYTQCELCGEYWADDTIRHDVEIAGEEKRICINCYDE